MKIILRLDTGESFDPNELWPENVTTPPRVGDTLQGPDDYGRFVVNGVLWDFAAGFIGGPPMIYVDCVREGHDA